MTRKEQREIAEALVDDDEFACDLFNMTENVRWGQVINKAARARAIKRAIELMWPKVTS